METKVKLFQPQQNPISPRLCRVDTDCLQQGCYSNLSSEDKGAWLLFLLKKCSAQNTKALEIEKVQPCTSSAKISCISVVSAGLGVGFFFGGVCFESRFSAQKKTCWNEEYTINAANQLNRCPAACLS